MPVQNVFGREEEDRPEEKGRSWVGWVLRPSRPLNSKSAAIETDPLLAFASEEDARAREIPVPEAGGAVSEAGGAEARRRRVWPFVAGAVAAIALAGLATIAVTSVLPRLASRQAGTAGGTQPATLTVTTRPLGAQVSIDGEPRGVTPLTLAIAPGAHTLALRAGDEERVMPLTAVAGGDIVRDLEMSAAAPAAVLGGVAIVTDPPGARVTINGRPAGTSPVTVPDLAVGEHAIAVTGATGSVRRMVTVVGGQTASVVFSLPQLSGPVAGWLAVSVPFDVQVIEGGDIIGAGGGARIMLAAGRHDIAFVNRSLEYQESRPVEIRPGQTTSVSLSAPTVTVNVNARPWANVTVDGRDLGQTPIANAEIAVGIHEFVFRHPQLGERRQTMAVTGKPAQRIAVDLTR